MTAGMPVTGNNRQAAAIHEIDCCSAFAFLRYGTGKAKLPSCRYPVGGHRLLVAGKPPEICALRCSIARLICAATAASMRASSSETGTPVKPSGILRQ